MRAGRVRGGAAGAEGGHRARLRHEGPQEDGHGRQGPGERSRLIREHKVDGKVASLKYPPGGPREGREGHPGGGRPPVGRQDVLQLPGTYQHHVPLISLCIN